MALINLKSAFDIEQNLKELFDYWLGSGKCFYKDRVTIKILSRHHYEITLWSDNGRGEERIYDLPNTIGDFMDQMKDCKIILYFKGRNKPNISYFIY